MDSVVSPVPHVFDPDVFWDNVRGDGDCWVWVGKQMPNGYGIVQGYRFTERAAHRLSWTMANGPIPAGLFVCHRCDNPPCVNPEHLFLGTAADNVHDSQSKGRRPKLPFPRVQVWAGPRDLTCRHGHEWTPETEIRFGDGLRRCRVCARIRDRAYRASKRAA